MEAGMDGRRPERRRESMARKPDCGGRRGQGRRARCSKVGRGGGEAFQSIPRVASLRLRRTLHASVDFFLLPVLGVFESYSVPLISSGDEMMVNLEEEKQGMCNRRIRLSVDGTPEEIQHVPGPSSDGDSPSSHVLHLYGGSSSRWPTECLGIFGNPGCPGAFSGLNGSGL